MQKGIVFFICYVFTFFSYAQYPVIHHLDWMQAQSNPAFLGVNKQEFLLLDYNRSWISNEVNSNLGILHYDRAFVSTKNRNYGGIGGSILNNRVYFKEVFNRFQASFGGAYALRVNRESYLNFGLQGTYFSDFVNNLGLFTGSQYVPGMGFITGSGNNEPGNNLKTDYFGISTGLFLYEESDGVLPENYLGLSIKNFNRPVNAFYSDNSRLSLQININGGLRLFNEGRNMILGELFYAYTNQKSNMIIGGVYQISNLKNVNGDENNMCVRFISRYAVNQKFLIGAQVIYEHFVIGLTYDIPTAGARERTFDNGFEILLGFHRKVKSKQKNIKPKTTKNTAVDRTLAKTIVLDKGDSIPNNDRISVDVIPADSVESIIQKTGEAMVGKLIEDEPLTGKIYFEFASSNLTIDSDNFLRAFISEFHLRGKSKIVVSGHTDSIGDRDFNQRLSIERAESVRKKMILYGIKEDQILVEGRGEENPLLPNNSMENRAKNRRVEITFY